MKSVLVLVLTLLPLLSFSQDEMGAGGTDTVLEDERALEELQRAQLERQQKIERVGDITENLDPVEKIQNVNYQQFNPASLLNKEALAHAEAMIKRAELHKVPPDVVREKILDSFKGHALENFVRSSPNLQNFMVDFMRDEKALIGGIGIFKDRQRLKLYLYFWIGIMFATYYTRKLFISKFWSRPVKAIASMIFSLTVTTITMSTFCLIFEAEMRPIIALIKKYI